MLKNLGLLVPWNQLPPILSILFSLGFSASIFRLYHDYDTKDEVKLFFGTMFISRTIFAFLLLLFLFLFQDYVQFLYKSINFYPFYIYVIVSVFIESFFDLPQKYLMLKEKALFYIILSVLNFLIRSILILWIIIYDDGGAAGYLKAGMIASIISLPIFIFLSIKIIRFSFSFTILKSILQFSLPIIPTLLFGWVMDLSDRVFINQYIGVGEVGIYSVGYKIASIGLFIITSYQIAYRPIFFKLAKSNNIEISKIQISRYNQLFIVVMIYCFFVIAFLSKEVVILFFKEEYERAYMIIPLILVSYLFNGLQSLVGRYIEQSKKMKQGMYMAFSIAIINIILNYLLIPAFGIKGAAYATMISFGLSFGQRYLYAKRKCFFIPFNWTKIIPIFSVLTIIFLLFQFLPNFESIYYSLILKTFIILLLSVFFLKSYLKEFKKLLFKK